MKNPVALICFVSLVLLISACGEGGTGGTGYTDSSKRVLSVGVITVSDNNEITVKDVTFNVANSKIEIDSKTKTSTDLHVGMVAMVDGVVNGQGTAGSASSVNISTSVYGPITEVRSANMIVVLDQIVNLTAETKISKDRAPSVLVVGMDITVNGFNGADGEIQASYIDTPSEVEPYSVSGYVKALDQDLKQFNLGSLVVNYSSVSLDATDLSVLKNGQFVDVEGSLTSPGFFTASTIEFKKLSINAVEQLELEGFINAKSSDDEFSLHGVPVKVTSSTVFEHGLKANIAVGVKAHVKGAVLSGTLIAQRIELEISDEQEIDTSVSGSKNDGLPTTTNSVKSVVSTVLPDTSQLTLAALPGTTFSYDDTTVMTGFSASKPLQSGYTVNVITTDSTTHLASISLVEANTTEDIVITAIPSKIESPYVWLFDSQIDLSLINNLNAASPDQFIAQLTGTKKVYLQGKLIAGNPVWGEADIK